ncbi:3-phosphoshikimate 1-carboxyvinyltransferase [Nitratiruptor sp. SB155-2]|uniref:3-phosphoshikimate 1-carboxyvinyltransferase n=1 Tax=Nitratiruptor sp. (strain SB155-2) TaxID=387092 RepID=AROA_NITSB|nr:3-phosphoshikimate 1-carboxyvinyltransferase [Nitratiruptor sp. SB155-2]A6Q2R6.1 RecName: Full=3-phosphoshikimate 1-carboxyvinyltransferase; AltName: Full=5-enolpyruvylshikimate-3-phosphate synthase; Short=EPSP synthase; Short=EPSPS [Nitratiruptor sp. SB155-2]BAF69775.1 3-phosphoshikimate 1-carboxyvinyltransferase [Nitratiruptor sp. SB155-2]
MSYVKVEKASSFELTISDIAPDKSISHRSAMFSLLSDEPSQIENFLRAEDTLNTLEIVKALGAQVEESDEKILIKPPKQIQEPKDVLDCGNSGTGMRLFCGLLAGINGFFVLTGDKYLRERPMARVAKPLRSIGAKIDGRDNGNKAPLALRGNTDLEPFDYESPIASAQVKSALILAALRAKGECSISEPELSRDHTERMLQGMGANIDTHWSHGRYRVDVVPLTKPLEPLKIRIPADPSSAFFFAVAAAIAPRSKVVLENITLNPTRIEAFKVLQKMGADVVFLEKENKYEPIGDIIVTHNSLHGVEVSENIPWLIDELPALAIAMAVADGRSIVRNAKELRVKESDRITCVVENLKKCGIQAQEFEDGYEIIGGELHSAAIDSCGDHRIAMSFLIAGLVSGMEVRDIECIKTSFPNFLDLLSQIVKVERGD